MHFHISENVKVARLRCHLKHISNVQFQSAQESRGGRWKQFKFGAIVSGNMSKVVN